MIPIKGVKMGDKHSKIPLRIIVDYLIFKSLVTIDELLKCKSSIKINLSLSKYN